MADQPEWVTILIAILVVVLVALLITCAVYSSRTPIGTASKSKSGIDIQSQSSLGPAWVVKDSSYTPPAVRTNLGKGDGEQYSPPSIFADSGSGLGGVTLEPVEGSGPLVYSEEVEEIFANANNRILAIAENYVGQPETRYQGSNSGGDDGFMALFGNASRNEAWTLERCRDVLAQRNAVPDFALPFCEALHGPVFNIGRQFYQLE